MNISVISSDQIDKKRYDEVINASPNGTIYAQSWFLDTVFPDWLLLATNDYSYVMPYPQKKKYGLPVVLQPMCCQQLGVFSSLPVTRDVVEAFLCRIKSIYTIIYLNTGNVFDIKGMSLRDNYVLDLNASYETLRTGYATNTRRFLKKALSFSLTLDKTMPVESFQELVSKNTNVYTEVDMRFSFDLIREAKQRQSVLLYGVMSDDEYISAVAFFLYKRRIYLMTSVSTEEGRKKQGMRFVVDSLIREYAESDYVLDFEGSSVLSVAEFYRSFGAVNQPYPEYRSTLARLFK